MNNIQHTADCNQTRDSATADGLRVNGTLHWGLVNELFIVGQYTSCR